MTILTSKILLQLLLIFSTTRFPIIISTNDQSLVKCHDKDKEILLIFKIGILDSSDCPTSTWSTNTDCCIWEGVTCDNATGRVTELDLNDSRLKGQITLSVLELEYISHVNLGLNDFDAIIIPINIHNITHSSKLVYLDLTIIGIDLNKATNWLQAMAKLPSLLELQLNYCNLSNFMTNPPIEHFNLPSLKTLVASQKNFTSSIPDEFFNCIKNVTYLDLN
ncbi:LRR amino-terminal domain protein [Medicago truncatula]|uniref:LRR amino-terminal domain protein n=1 Tax=Medicago truncatula TaxID=3880 RepID=G7IG73_MEDTR|nr:LRR amino-terminal domain protein [Medicago truncatula]